MINIKTAKIKKIKVFFSVIIICSALFSLTGITLIRIPKSKTVAKEQYSGIPYSSNSITLFLKATELPVCFLIELNPKLESANVTALPSLSVKSSSVFLNDKETKNDYSGFFNCSVDYVLTIDNKALTEIINISNGITANTPFGLPSPSGNGKLIAENECLHIYGDTLINIMAFEKQPKSEHLKYYSELMGLVLKEFISEFTEDKYILLKEHSVIDISFPKYYNNKTSVQACAKNITASFVDGVWIDNYYYVYN